MVRELTEHKHAEEKLIESEERYKRITAGITDYLYTVKIQNGKVVETIHNDVCIIITGYSPKEFAEDSYLWINMVLPEEREMVTENFSKIIKGKEISPIEHRIICKDGKIKWVSDTAILKYDSNGEVVSYDGVIKDITERKLTEETLRRNEVALKEAQRLGGLGSWDWDALTDTILWSDEYYRIYGFDPNKLPPGYVEHLKVYTPESAARLDEAVKKNMKTGEPYEIDLELADLKNPTRWITARSETKRDGEGKIIGLRGTAQNITDRKRAEEEIWKLNQDLEKRVLERTAQFENANKELETFAYSVSHDLRSPLRSIDGFSQTLLEDYNNKFDEQGKYYLQRVRSSAQRMAQLIDDLLNLSRVSLSEINIRQVNLSKIAHEIADNLHGVKPERNVEFIIHEGIKVKGDGRLLRIVLENLIGNSWKFTSKKLNAHIEFGTKQLNEKIVYFVRDDGAGFEMRYVQQLYGAFQRLHTATEFPGTGIGLATVQRIILRHGGEVWAEGEVEKGATFYFTISERVLK